MSLFCILARRAPAGDVGNAQLYPALLIAALVGMSLRSRADLSPSAGPQFLRILLISGIIQLSVTITELGLQGIR